MLNLMNQILAIKFGTSKVRHMEDLRSTINCHAAVAGKIVGSLVIALNTTESHSIFIVFIVYNHAFSINTVSTHLTNVEKSFLWLE